MHGKSEDRRDARGEETCVVSEAAEFLEISQEELLELIQKHDIPVHQAEGAPRLKKQDLEHLKNKWRIERELFPKPERFFSHHQTTSKPTWIDRLYDFWHYNDFYLICSALILGLLYFIVSSQ